MNLIEKLQQATEGSRQLDVEIHNAVYGTEYKLNGEFPVWIVDENGHMFDKDGDFYNDILGYYTSSIDGAITLVPDNGEATFSTLCRCSVFDGKRSTYYDGGSTPPIAIVLACLRARGIE